MSLTLQKKYKFNQYFKPILVGYSSGATLVYGMLAQAPANTFKGAISLGFCPDIELSDHFLMTGSKVEILPGSHHYSDDFNAMSTVIFKDLPAGNQ